MTPEELRAIINDIRERVQLDAGAPEGSVTITFRAPTEAEMIAAGLNADGVKRLLGFSWWQEMVADIIETPEFCEPDDPPQQVLTYAKDVVSDYIRKRFPLEGK